MTTPEPINLDASSAVAFVSEGSPVRAQPKAFVRGRKIVMCATAHRQFRNIVATIAGTRESARASRLLNQLALIPDAPSARSVILRPTNNLDTEDIMIFGTGDALGAITMTSDGKALRAMAAQGVRFATYLHAPAPLRKL